MAQYKAKAPIHHDGEIYEEGSLLPLVNERQIAQLSEAQAIEIIDQVNDVSDDQQPDGGNDVTDPNAKAKKGAS